MGRPRPQSGPPLFQVVASTEFFEFSPASFETLSTSRGGTVTVNALFFCGVSAVATSYSNLLPLFSLLPGKLTPDLWRFCLGQNEAPR